jgi:hypothetical protein
MLSTVEFSIHRPPDEPGEARAQGFEPCLAALETVVLTVTPCPHLQLI